MAAIPTLHPDVLRAARRAACEGIVGDFASNLFPKDLRGFWMEPSRKGLSRSQLRSFLGLCLRTDPAAWAAFLDNELRKPRSPWREYGKKQTEGLREALELHTGPEGKQAVRNTVDEAGLGNPPPDEAWVTEEATRLVRAALDRVIRECLRARDRQRGGQG